MGDSQEREGATVSSDGLTVDKRFEEDEFPVPAIAFEIRSDRSETVTIRLVDVVPDGVSVEDLGFHPEYGSEYWTIEEDEITFEREIEAGAEYTTVYGIRATGTDDVDQFLGEPTIEAVEPSLDEDAAVVDSDGSDVVRDVIAGDSDSVPGLDDEDTDGEDVETLDLSDPNSPADGTDDGPPVAASAASRTSASAGDEGGGGDGDGDGDADADPGTLTAALAAEIRRGNVDSEDVELLRRALDLTDEESGTTAARIERLQTQVADLAAYTDALEEFLDENGTGEEMIAEFRERVDSVESELEEVRALAEAQEESVVALEERVEDGIDDLDERVGDLDERLDTLDEQLGDLDEQLDELDERVEDVDVGDLEAQVSEAESDIEDLKEWREQLSSVIGG